MLSDKLVRECFEHKEEIAEHLDVAVKYTAKYEPERLGLMIEAQKAMAEKNYKMAVDKLKDACYTCMARAIQIHFLEKD